MNAADRKAFSPGVGLPFSTTDAILAQCLRIAGIPETPLSPRNIYDENILFKAGAGIKDDAGNVVRKSRFAGLSLIEAAKTAWKSPQPVKGRIEYQFEHTPDTGYLVNAYRDQERLIKESDGDAAEAIREIMRLAAGRLNEGERVMDEREALLRLLCVALKTRIEYVNRWKQQVPILHIRGNHKKSVTTHGSHKVESHVLDDKFVPLNASDDLLKKMQLI